jgi:fido (protein-threonine AMPylation protein)
MATPAEKLAQSLEVLHKFQNDRGIAVIKASDITRTHKDRLVSGGFIREVIKGWYISTTPDDKEGETTFWFISYWNFVSAYFNDRFGKDWCLSPEQSLSIHSGNYTLPKQLLVRSPKASNNLINLLYNTSFLDVNSSIPPTEEILIKDGINLFSLPSALISCSPSFFSQHPVDSRIALAIIHDPSDILTRLLKGGHSRIAGRLTGAFRNIGREHIADEILSAMRSAGYDVREIDPFEERLPASIDIHEPSPYVNRIKLIWQNSRQIVIDNFPGSAGLSKNIDEYLKKVDDIYVSDAYHSLSIEGYRVSPELIEKVRSGDWNPDEDEEDRKYKDAMVARGYWQSFQAVKASIKEILKGKNPGIVAKKDLGKWYRELFAPGVAAGIIEVSDLAGYRNGPVYIKGSRHTPPGSAAIRDAMPALFDLLKKEKEPSVRAVLGHFIFVYLHPYMDGNGRIGRFLMNVMLASGGYPWTVISVADRETYMECLEKASVGQDISAFAKFLARLVKEGLK